MSRVPAIEKSAIAIVTIQDSNPDQPRDHDAGNLVYLSECGVWIDVVARITVDRPDLLILNQTDCAANGHVVSDEEDDLYEAIKAGATRDTLAMQVKTDDLGWTFNAPARGLSPDWYAVRWTGTLTVPPDAVWVASGRSILRIDPATGLIEQHRGFDQLEAVDLSAFEPRTTTMEVLLGWGRLGRLKLVKQADVVLLLALLGERYPRAVQQANFGYYEPLTVHDSSLSPAVHALVAARLGELEAAERYLAQASTLDLDFDQGVTAAGGVHVATLGGIWQALVFGFGGMTVADGQPRFIPQVPASWGSLRFRVRWQGGLLEVTATATTATVTTHPQSAGDDPTTVPGSLRSTSQ